MNRELEDNIKRKLHEFRNAFFQFPWDDRDFYGQWLAQSYYYLTHTTHLLSLTAGYCKENPPFLQEKFQERLKSDKSIEQLALMDMESLDFNILDFPEFYETKLFHKAQVKVIQRHGPKVFMGWMAFLENLLVRLDPELAGNLKGTSLKNGLKFLNFYSYKNEINLFKLFEYINDLDTDTQNKLLDNFDNSLMAYISILDAVLESASETTDMKSPEKHARNTQ